MIPQLLLCVCIKAGEWVVEEERRPTAKSDDVNECFARFTSNEV